jgi:hypothetical protein
MDVTGHVQGQCPHPGTPCRIGRQQGRLGLVVNSNVEEIRAMTRDPQAAEVQKYYEDPTVMRYSDEQLETPRV